MSGWKGLNRVEHVLLIKVILVGHQHRAHKTTSTGQMPEVAAHLDISYGSAYAILHDDLGYRKVRTVGSQGAYCCAQATARGSCNTVR